MGVCKSVEDKHGKDGSLPEHNLVPPIVEVTGVVGPGDMLLGEYSLLGLHEKRPYYQKRAFEDSRPVYLFSRGGCWIFSDKLWSKQGGAYVRSDTRLPLTDFVGNSWIVRHDKNWVVVNIKVKEYFPPCIHISAFLGECMDGEFDILGEYRGRPFYRRRQRDDDEILYLYYHFKYACWMIGPKLWSHNCAMFLETSSLSPLNINSQVSPTVLTASGWVKDPDLDITELAWWLEEEHGYADDERDVETDTDESIDATTNYDTSSSLGSDNPDAKLWRRLVVQAPEKHSDSMKHQELKKDIVSLHEHFSADDIDAHVV